MTVADEKVADEESVEEPDEKPGGSLLEEDAAKGEQPAADEPPPTDMAEIVKKAVEEAVAEANRVADRRINQALDKMKGKQPEDGPKGDPPDVQPGVNAREARLAFREYLSDQMQFLGSEERAMAMEMGSALIAVGVATADDEDVLGREVAATVAARINEQRTFYEERTKAALRSRGLLGDGKQDQPVPGGDQVGGQSEFEKGAALARERFEKKE